MRRIPTPAESIAPPEVHAEASERILHDPELAAFLGWSPATPRNYRCRGLGPPHRKRPGSRSVYYLMSDVVRWLRSAPLYRSTAESAVAASEAARAVTPATVSTPSPRRGRRKVSRPRRTSPTNEVAHA